MTQRKHHLIFLSFLLSVLLVLGCEKQIPLSAFDFNYSQQYKIEADLYPQNLGKSVLRIDHTFTIEDSMSVETAHIKDASASLFGPDGTELSTFSWDDSAATYRYYDNNINSPFLDSIDQHLDTLTYGGYTLDNVEFTMKANQEYELRVVIDGETYHTTFQPYPLISFESLEPDSVVIRKNENGKGTYRCIYVTMTADSARLLWEEDLNAYLYTVIIEQINGILDIGPQAFAFPGPALNLNFLPGTYKVVIGAMDQRFYDYYYLDDFPPNHPNRNFFNGTALGYAGSVNERYLNIRIVP